jgi:hypothetical protein
MEAGDAGIAADPTVAADVPPAAPESLGDAVIVVCGIFEPGAVVDLVHVEGEHVLRAEGGETVGRRTADSEGNVGFDGLIADGYYFVTGYNRGRYEERRCVAREAGESTAFVQPPVQVTPQTIGTGEVPPAKAPGVEVSSPAVPSATLGEGLPEGVESPVLERPAPDPAPVDPAAEETKTTAGPVIVDGMTTTTDIPTSGSAPADIPPAPAPDASALPDPSATPGASDAPPSPVLDVPASADPAAPADPSTTPATDGASTAAGSVTDGAPLADPSAALVADAPPADVPVEADRDKLVKQAREVGVLEAERLSAAELRQAITEKNVTPVV